MAGTKITLNSAGFKELLTSASVRSDLRNRAQRVLAAAQGAAPVDSGAYRDSLHVVEDTTDRAVARVVSDSAYARIVEANTGTLARALDAGR